MTLKKDLVAGKTKPKLGAIVDLLERSGIDIEEISRVERVSIYEGYIKNPQGEIEKTDLHAIKLVPNTADAPKWPVIQPGPLVKLPSFGKPEKVVGWQTAVVLPDMQIGYFRLADDKLEPTHDESAISAALSLIKSLKPTQVICVGDNLDLPEFGKYRTSPAFQRTTKSAIDRATLLCAQLRTAAPQAEIVWLAGNHEERLPNWVLDNAKAAFGMRRGTLPDEKPDEWPVISIPYLCRMKRAGIDYRPGYPASHHWITPRLKVIHGDKHTSTGSTAHKYLISEKTSVIFGHIHRREYAARTRDDHNGPREVMAASPGCLARIDGAVPSTKGGIDLDGRPIVRHEDWQQGIAVVEFDSKSGQFDYHNIAIRDGQARWQGKIYK